MAQQEQTSETNGTDERSMPELIKAVATDTSTLVKQEVELARHEIVEALVARAKAAGAFAAGGVMALYVLLFLIVAGAFAVLALGAVLFGRFRIKRPPMAPEETKRTVKEDVEWAKTQLRR